MNNFDEKYHRQFIKFFESYYKKKMNNEKQPFLIENLENILAIDDSPNVDATNMLKENGFITIDINSFKSESTEYPNLYSPEFERSIIGINDIITNISIDKNIKFVLLGKFLQKFHCNNNNYNDRFVYFILTYIKKIIYNKNLLRKHLKQVIINAIGNIGNCDRGSETISNKEIEDWFRKTFSQTKFLDSAEHFMINVGSEFDKGTAKPINDAIDSCFTKETCERLENGYIFKFFDTLVNSKNKGTLKSKSTLQTPTKSQGTAKKRVINK